MQLWGLVLVDGHGPNILYWIHWLLQLVSDSLRMEQANVHAKVEWLFHLGAKLGPMWGNGQIHFPHEKWGDHLLSQPNGPLAVIATHSQTFLLMWLWSSSTWNIRCSSKSFLDLAECWSFRIFRYWIAMSCQRKLQDNSNKDSAWERGECCFMDMRWQDTVSSLCINGEKRERGILKEAHVILEKLHSHYLNLLDTYSNKSKMFFYSQNGSNVFIHAHHISYFH